MLGDGAAVDPEDNTVYAPFDGTLINLNPNLHAVVFSDGKLELLVHIGLETVSLKGKGFTAHAKQGDKVRKGQKIITFDKDFILQHAPCAWVMCVLTAPADTPVTPRTGRVAHGECLFYTGDAPAEASVPEETPAQTQAEVSVSVTICNPHGLHARPAGQLAQAAKKFPFPITLHKADKTADAKSVVSVLGLALRAGDEAVLSAPAAEPSARAALAELADFIAGGLGEDLSAPAPVPTTAEVSAPAVPAQTGGEIKGLTACGGLAEGKTFFFKHAEISFTEIAQNPQEEKQRFEESLRTLAERLQQQSQTASGQARTIAEAHLHMLQDPFLAQETLRTLAQGKTAAYSFNEAVRKSIDVLRQTGSAFLAERIADFKDLRRNMLLLLLGRQQAPCRLEPDTLILAEDLLPSDVALFQGRVTGVVLTAGSPTSHLSILLRNQNIPTLVNTRVCFDAVPDGTPALLDAGSALFLDPVPALRQAFHQRLLAARQADAQNRADCRLPAVTQDGLTIDVGGNINSAPDAKTAFENGADSLGLVRTEFLFMRNTNAPSEDEQAQIYQAVVGALNGKPVTLRTLDIGGDKPLPYLPIPPEDNPMLGVRGARLYGANRELFRTQIRAMLRVRPLSALRIMLPMITFPEEMYRLREIIETERKQLAPESRVRIGMMVETPAAALTTAQFAPAADFFSIGTNDLTQYTLAIDRGHKVLSPSADGLSPALLRLIALTAQGAREHHRPVAVCGALAGDTAAVPLLIGLGVTELAVGAGAVAQVKALVRRLNAAQCRQAAAHALTLADAHQVRDFVKQTFADKENA